MSRPKPIDIPANAPLAVRIAMMPLTQPIVFMSRQQVIEELGLHRTGFDKLCRDQQFPRGIAYNGNHIKKYPVAWVRAFQEAKLADAREKALAAAKKQRGRRSA